jgi:hypothetical protein
MTGHTTWFKLPDELVRVAAKHAGPTIDQIVVKMRRPDECMTPSALNAQKATRLSFTQLLAQRMIAERWQFSKERVEFDAEGRGWLVYQIDFGKYQSTYIAQSFQPSGEPNENLGRRAGAKRDVFGTLFLSKVSAERIDEELRMVAPRDSSTMRARSDVLGWTPGSRSHRIFDDVVAALVEGNQPAPEVIRRSGYLIRNGGFIASGRAGTISYGGIPDDHPLKAPYFADLFGLLMLRAVGEDLVNGIAAARSPKAAKLSEGLATFFGVGNASGQGMCVALQRWPQWLSTWVLVREFCLARANLMSASKGSKAHAQLLDLVGRGASYYEFVMPDSEEFMVPHKQIADNLRIIESWIRDDIQATSWGDLTIRIRENFDSETAEAFNALLIEVYPEFADDVAAYIPIGMSIERDYSPEMTVAKFRSQYLSDYAWELSQDLGLSSTRQHFWYHSADNGEQRRGERIIDPHEQFESFIDHFGILQRLAAILSVYPDDTPMGLVVADHPELAFAAARVETMAHRPYKEVHGNLLHKDFSPAHLIRFYLAVLGLETTYPMSIRYVPGVLFQGFPRWQQVMSGTQSDWKFSNVSALEQAA